MPELLRATACSVVIGVVAALICLNHPLTIAADSSDESPAKKSKFASNSEAEAGPKARLLEKGVRVSHSGLSLSDETELSRNFGQLSSLKRKLQSAAKELRGYEAGVDQIQDNLSERLRANVELNAQLARVARVNVVEHNQLVGAVNSNSSAINLLMQEKEQTKKDVDAARKYANEAREKYAQQIADLRGIADRVSEKYKSLKADQDVQSALDEWNKAANTSFELKPSRNFQNSLKRLETLEKSIRSEKITLRRVGNSFYVTVTINGDHTEEMILDTGADSLVLPYKDAIACGVRPEESAVTVIATIADGSKVKSKQVILDSVRIGQFTAKKVECIVLPPEAKNAPLLLGMTYLSRFNFSINGTDLLLSTVDGEHAAVKDTKKSKTSKSTRRPRRSESPSE